MERLPFPSPGDLPNPGIKPRSSALQANAFPSQSPRMQGNSSGKEPTKGDIKTQFPPSLARSRGGGHGDPLQYSCLENPVRQKPGRLQPIG